MDTLRIFTLDHPIEVDPGAVSPAFNLLRVNQYDCSQNYTTGTQSDRAFNFSFSDYQLSLVNGCVLFLETGLHRCDTR